MNFNFYKSLNPISAWASVFVALVVGISVFYSDFLFYILSWIRQIFVLNISWFYILVIFLLFCLCVYLIFSRYGNLKIGSLSKPKYNTFSWIAMLFSAGMGTGLLFSGVYEPVYHYILPPTGRIGGTQEAFNQSFQLTFLHWGFSGWTIYACMGLFFSYFCLSRKKPIRLSYVLSPILKNKTEGPLGYFVDVVAIVSILFGVACTLGRGTMQIASGLEHVFQLSSSKILYVWIIVGITICATLSVISGLNRGIRRLSEINIVICLLLLGVVLFIGPTLYIFNSFVEQSGAYLQNLIEQMTRIRSLGSAEWRARWTILYWAWWFAWSPFVGLFLAKISEGRSIRSFIIGTVFVPSFISFLWFSAFGGGAIYYQTNQHIDLSPLLEHDYPLLLFKFLDLFPFATLLCVLSLISISLFFITSSDSASYIIHSIASYKNKPSGKIYWAVMEGLLALILLILGGIQSLELLVIITAFPFTLLLILACYGFLKELKKSG